MLPPLMPQAVTIGDYYTDALAGLVFYTSAKNSVLMQIGWFDADGKKHEGYKDLMAAEPRFGAAAPDDSYHRLDWKVDGQDVRFEWGKTGPSSAVARVRSQGKAKLVLDFGPGWPGSRPEVGSVHQDALSISSGDLKLNVEADGVQRQESLRHFASWRIGVRNLAPKQDQAPSRSSHVSRVFNIGPTTTLTIAVSDENPIAPHRVEETLNEAAAKYEKSRTKAAGDWGDFASPISNQLGHSRVLSPETGRLAHTVSRGWCLPDGQVLFCWDSFFNGLLSSLENPAAGRATVRAILAAQQPNGLIPNFFGRGWGVSADRSQPPVGSLCVWKMYERDPDGAFLEEVYPKLLRWHHFWFANGPDGKPNRDGNNDGLLEWGSATDDLQNAKFESGLDDSPMFDTGAMSGPHMTIDSTDLSALYAMDADYLARIAQAIGRNEDARTLRKDRDAMASRINKLLWNEDIGTYCYRYWTPRPEQHEVALKDLISTSAGLGLRAEYFKGRSFDKKVGERQDSDISFDWTNKSPFEGLGSEDYSVRWTGTFTAQSSDPYVFTTSADDGVRLWLDGELLIDDWKVHGTTQDYSKEVRLVAGTAHDLKVEYFQAAGGAEARLRVEEIDEAAPPQTFYPRLSPLNFYPMMAGIPSESQGAKMLSLFFKQDKFGGEYMCPTISRDDPAYPAQGYWRGTVWGPTNYLFYQGLRRYGSEAQRTEFAKKSVALFMKNWNADGTCHENFNAITGEGRSDPHYTWGSLLCLIGIEELCDIEPNGKLRLNGASGAHVRIRNLHLGGKTYDLRVEPRLATLSRNGRVVARAAGRAEEYPWPLSK